MKVFIISEEVAMDIVGKEYADGQLYYPVQLPDGRWYIGVAEAKALGINEFVEVELERLNLTELTNENE